MPDFLLLDVILLSMGLETANDVMVKLIEPNITCFTEKGQTFTTYADNQSGVHIQAFKRERMTAEDNNSLEKSHLDGIPPAPCGLPQDEAISDINAYGMVGAFVLVTNDGGMFYEFVIARVNRSAVRCATETAQDGFGRSVQQQRLVVPV